MKTIKFLIVILFLGFTHQISAQELSADKVLEIMNNNDAKTLTSLLNKNNINNCYINGAYNYSLLSHAVGRNAVNCFNSLIANGADVNKTCDGYVPRIMHAAKYGRLAMLKVLISKGADKNYVYHGSHKLAENETPLTYAEKYEQATIVDYLKSLNK